MVVSLFQRLLQEMFHAATVGCSDDAGLNFAPGQKTV